MLTWHTKIVQRQLMKDRIFVSMGPPPFHGVISFYAWSSQILSEFIPGLLIDGPEFWNMLKFSTAEGLMLGATSCEGWMMFN
jgi:hypothetical protein